MSFGLKSLHLYSLPYHVCRNVPCGREVDNQYLTALLIILFVFEVDNQLKLFRKTIHNLLPGHLMVINIKNIILLIPVITQNDKIGICTVSRNNSYDRNQFHA